MQKAWSAQTRMFQAGEKGRGGRKIQGWSHFCLQGCRSSPAETGGEGVTGVRDSRSPRGRHQTMKNIRGNVWCSDGSWPCCQRAVVSKKFREVDKGIEWKVPCVIKLWPYPVVHGKPPNLKTPLLLLPTAEHIPT